MIEIIIVLSIIGAVYNYFYENRSLETRLKETHKSVDKYEHRKVSAEHSRNYRAKAVRNTIAQHEERERRQAYSDKMFNDIFGVND